MGVKNQRRYGLAGLKPLPPQLFWTVLYGELAKLIMPIM
jgi:hypothetical protein